MAEAKRKKGILMIVAGFIFELAGIGMMAMGTAAPVRGISLITIGLALVAVGLGTLRRDRDANALKKPANSGM